MVSLLYINSLKGLQLLRANHNLFVWKQIKSVLLSLLRKTPDKNGVTMAEKRPCKQNL